MFQVAFLVFTIFFLTLPQKCIAQNTIYITEIAARATGNSTEWIELFNASTTSFINLNSWQICSKERCDTISITDVIMKPYSYLVLTKNKKIFDQTFPFQIPSLQTMHWPLIDNNADTISIYNFSVTNPVETCCFDRRWFIGWDHQPIQRITTLKSGLDKNNWEICNTPSPGMPNSTLFAQYEKPSLLIHPLFFTPNNDGIDDLLLIDLTTPPGYQSVIEIYSFNGQKIKSFFHSSLQQIFWNGITVDHRKAENGPFYVIAKCTTGERTTIIRKKGVLWR